MKIGGKYNKYIIKECYMKSLKGTKTAENLMKSFMGNLKLELDILIMLV